MISEALPGCDSSTSCIVEEYNGAEVYRYLSSIILDTFTINKALFWYRKGDGVEIDVDKSRQFYIRAHVLGSQKDDFEIGGGDYFAVSY